MSEETNQVEESEDENPEAEVKAEQEETPQKKRPFPLMLVVLVLVFVWAVIAYFLEMNSGDKEAKTENNQVETKAPATKKADPMKQIIDVFGDK